MTSIRILAAICLVAANPGFAGVTVSPTLATIKEDLHVVVTCPDDFERDSDSISPAPTQDSVSPQVKAKGQEKGAWTVEGDVNYDTPSSTREEVLFQYKWRKGEGSSEEVLTDKARATVVKLEAIMGIVDPPRVDAFQDYPHFYLGDSPNADTMEIRLKYKPENLFHSDLRDEWLLDGACSGGQIEYRKNEAEPKWKGTVPLSGETWGRIHFTAAWGEHCRAEDRHLTKFSLRVIPLFDAPMDMYALKEKEWTSLQFVATIVPSGVEDEYPDVKYEWEIVQGKGKVKLSFDGDNRKYCTITPAGYKRNQVSEAIGDIQIKASWTVPKNSYVGYNTASKTGAFTVRTPMRIHMYDYAMLTAWEQNGPKQWRLYYEVLDNLSVRLPDDIAAGLTVKEKWRKNMFDYGIPSTPNHTLTGATFNDTIGTIGRPVLPGRYTGTQQLICDQITGWHDVMIDATEPNGEVTSGDVVAPGF
jgi:hypothetical protein